MPPVGSHDPKSFGARDLAAAVGAPMPLALPEAFGDAEDLHGSISPSKCASDIRNNLTATLGMSAPILSMSAPVNLLRHCIRLRQDRDTRLLEHLGTSQVRTFDSKVSIAHTASRG